MQKEEILLDCRAGGGTSGVNGTRCIDTCGRICARLSGNLAAKLSSELQMEWAKGQAMLMLLEPHSPDIADGRQLPQQLREKWEQAQMQTPTGRPEDRKSKRLNSSHM